MSLVPEKLNNKHKLAALLEARGEMNIKEIAEAVALTLPRLSTVRKSVEYRLLTEKYRSELVDRTLDQAAQLLANFNRAAPDAFRSLEMIHKDTGARDGARVAAAREILERASIAPRKQREEGAGETGIHIHLGVQSMTNIRTALEDVGDDEIIDLLDSEYSIDEGTPAQLGEEGPIEAKEVP